MTSSSPDARAVVLDGSDVTTRTLPARELRSGTWTRLAGGAVLGDPVTERALGGLVDEARAAAQAQGYSTGWAQGRQAAERQARDELAHAEELRSQAEERREAEHRAALAALARATEELHAAAIAICASVEERTAALAADLTEELLGHELAVAENPTLDAVRRALALLPGEPVVRVRVAPVDAACPELGAVAGTAIVVGDPSLHRGDVVVETAEAVLDARISGAMARVREVLAS